MEYGLLGLIIFVLDVVAIINILGSGAPATEKLLWVVVILLLPVVGLIIWWLMGRKTKTV